jgi:ABC-type phosphate transport system ATPase subunit
MFDEFAAETLINLNVGIFKEIGYGDKEKNSYLDAETLKSLLNLFLGQAEKKVFCITGMRGIGKSQMMRLLPSMINTNTIISAYMPVKKNGDFVDSLYNSFNKIDENVTQTYIRIEIPNYLKRSRKKHVFLLMML